jgi:hypothetical protein
MADKKISALTGATTPLAGTEVLPIVQGGSTVKVAVSDLTAGRAVGANGLTSTANVRTEYSSAGNVTTITNNTSSAAGSTSQLYNVNDASRALRIQYSSSGGPGGAAVTNGVATETAQIFTDGNYPIVLGTNVSAALILDTSQNAKIINNLIVGTAGKGIDFSANTHAAGMTSELLNWYEEGTWTATISDGTTDATMNAGRRTGTYTRVGRQVTVVLYVATTSMTGVTGNLRIKGLPFTVGNNDVGGGPVGYADQMTLIAGQVMVLQTQNGADYIVLRYWNGGTTSNMTGSQWGAIGEIGFTLTYFV